MTLKTEFKQEGEKSVGKLANLFWDKLSNLQLLIMQLLIRPNFLDSSKLVLDEINIHKGWLRKMIVFYWGVDGNTLNTQKSFELVTMCSH